MYLYWDTFHGTPVLQDGNKAATNAQYVCNKHLMTGPEGNS